MNRRSFVHHTPGLILVKVPPLERLKQDVSGHGQVLAKTGFPTMEVWETVVTGALIIEYGDSDCVVMGPNHIGEAENFINGVSWPAGYFRHNDGANYAFCDGHVKFMKNSSGTIKNIYYAAP